MPPYTYTGTHPELSVASTTQTVIRCDVSPDVSLTYQVEVTDSRGQRQEATAEVYVAKPGEPPLPPKKPDPPVDPPRPEDPARPDLNANGPLALALVELWEKTRKAKVNAVEKIVIKFFDAAATWKVHQALATLKDAEITCHFEADIKHEGVNSFQLDFDGRLDRANTVKSFLDPQLRTAAEHDFTGTYTLVFSSPLSTTVDRTDAFTRNLTRYGSGEAYVEAHAAPMEDGP